MNYSIAISTRTLKLRDEMYEFLQRNYRPWFEVLAEDEDEDLFHGPFIDEDLMGEGTCRLGFEYETGDVAEREYHFALMRWVAIQIGKRRSKFRTGESLSQTVPFLQFGSELRPIFVHKEWVADKRAPGPFVDNLGMRMGGQAERDLAWLCIPDDAYGKVSVAHWARPAPEVQEALISEGLHGAKELLRLIRKQLTEIDTLWAKRKP